MKINEENYEKRSVLGFPELTVYENEEERLLVKNVSEGDQELLHKREYRD